MSKSSKIGLWLGRGRHQRQAAKGWYRAIAMKAREPEPYLQAWVPDTQDGRVQMMALVSALVIRRLESIGDAGKGLGVHVTEAVLSGFDHALREEGIGDSSIARKVRRLGEEFLGLSRAIAQALKVDHPEAELVVVLERNAVTSTSDSRALAAWLLDAEKQLAGAAEPEVLAGKYLWSDAGVQG